MSFKIKKRDENRYVYFQISGRGDIFLSREGEVSGNPEKVFEALNYVKQRHGHYTEIEDSLLQYLPPQQKDQYISKRLKELETEQKHLLSLSPSAAKQYKPKGQVKAEGETRPRPLEQNRPMPVALTVDGRSIPTLEKVVEGIRFSVWSPEEIIKYSVAKIKISETYDKHGEPVKEGLMDRRLGTLEPNKKCLTCGKTSESCSGHFGHIELVEPILHSVFIDDVYELLLVICRSCSRLKISQLELDEYYDVMIKKSAHIGAVKNIIDEIIDKARKEKICPHCGQSQYELIFIRPTIFLEKTELGENRLLPIIIRERFIRMTDKDLKLLGYNPSSARPEWFVPQVLPIPPVTVRPSIILETGIRSEDDLTHNLVDIIRINQRLAESKDARMPPLIVQDLMDLLQYHVTTYFNHEISEISLNPSLNEFLLRDIKKETSARKRIELRKIRQVKQKKLKRAKELKTKIDEIKKNAQRPTKSDI